MNSEKNPAFPKKRLRMVAVGLAALAVSVSLKGTALAQAPEDDSSLVQGRERRGIAPGEPSPGLVGESLRHHRLRRSQQLRHNL